MGHMYESYFLLFCRFGICFDQIDWELTFFIFQNCNATSGFVWIKNYFDPLEFTSPRCSVMAVQFVIQPNKRLIHSNEPNLAAI